MSKKNLISINNNNNNDNKKSWLRALLEYFKTLMIYNNKIEITRKKLCEITNFNPIKLFNNLDFEKNGFLIPKNIIYFLNETLTYYDEQYIRYLIHTYDKDGDYNLNFSEFLSLILPVKERNLRNKILNKIKENINDNNNDIYPNEINIIFYELIKEEINLAKDSLLCIKKLYDSPKFTTYDTFINIVNNESYITSKNLKNFLNDNNFQINNEDDLYMLMFRIDANNDNRISYPEFQDIFYPLSKLTKNYANYPQKKIIYNNEQNNENIKIQGWNNINKLYYNYDEYKPDFINNFNKDKKKQIFSYEYKNFINKIKSNLNNLENSKNNDEESESNNKEIYKKNKNDKIIEKNNRNNTITENTKFSFRPEIKKNEEKNKIEKNIDISIVKLTQNKKENNTEKNFEENNKENILKNNNDILTKKSTDIEKENKKEKPINLIIQNCFRFSVNKKKSRKHKRLIRNFSDTITQNKIKNKDKDKDNNYIAITERILNRKNKFKLNFNEFNIYPKKGTKTILIDTNRISKINNYNNNINQKKYKNRLLFNLFYNYITQDIITENILEKLYLSSDFNIRNLYQTFAQNEKIDDKLKNIITINDIHKTLINLGLYTDIKDIDFIFLKFDKIVNSKEKISINVGIAYDEFCNVIKPKRNIFKKNKFNKYFLGFNFRTKRIIFELFKHFINSEKSFEIFRKELIGKEKNKYKIVFNLENLFNEIKKENSDKIDMDDICNFMEFNGKILNKYESKYFMDRFDKNKDGLIDFNEFLNEIIPKLNFKLI